MNSSSTRSSPALELDPRTYQRGLGCVHCGLCLPACPTYNLTGHEAESPRGRIQLMLGLAGGTIQPTATVRQHLDLCLDCRGCESACPSGVVYHELIEETRGKLAASSRLSAHDRLLRAVFFGLLTRPTRLKIALLPARLLQRVGLWKLLRKSGILNLLGPSLSKLTRMLPETGRLWPRRLPGSTSTSRKPPGERAIRVGFFSGCVGSVMFDSVNRKAVELLAASGADVLVPRQQVCCGAIHHHNGAHERAQELARKNIDAFSQPDGQPVDFVVTTIAGCGAMLREYDFLLRDEPASAETGRAFAGKVRDVSEVLALLGLPAMQHPQNITVTYHDACHLAHAQRVLAPPRELLSKIPGLTLVPLPESDLCCGAAGTYNLEHPQMARALAQRKLDNVAQTGAPVCAMGNVGCAMHLRAEAAERGMNVKVVHPVDLLHASVFGTRPEVD